MANYDIGDALHRIELLLLASMRRNLHRHIREEQDEGFRWSMWQAEQLTALGSWTRRNYRQYAPQFTKINQAAIGLLQQSAERAALVEEDLILRTGVQRAAGFFNAPEDKLSALTNAVRHDLSQAEYSILRQADDLYRQTLFDAHMYLQTGSGTLNNAIDTAVQDLMQRGIRSVTYRNGHRVEASVYARMALRSANVRAKLTGEGAARDKFGVHTVLVSPSGIACEKCAPWLGKVLVDDVYCSGTAQEAAEMKLPLLSDAIRQGFLHPQCNCAVHTYLPGEPPPPVTEQGRQNAVKRYKLTQQQRYNERQIRRWKYAEGAAPDEAAKKAAHAKVKAWQQQNQALCDAHPDMLRRDYQREKIWNAPKQPVVPDVIEKERDNPLTTVPGRGIMKPEGRDEVALENQRYGRNKDTLVNKTYIDSGDYRRKYDHATSAPAVNKTLYDCAKVALKHRSGTELEDMFWIDADTGELIHSVMDSTDKRAIIYTDKLKRAIKGKDNLITLHSHPSSMPPSIDDFNSAFKNGYKVGFVACHNGKLFRYTSNQEVSKTLYNLYISEFLDDGLSEYDAQLEALRKLMVNHAIAFSEVV